MLRKKFQGMKFRDFYELIAKVIEYEECSPDQDDMYTNLKCYHQRAII